MRERKLAETLASFRRGGSDGMVTRPPKATGEALPVPRGNSWRKVGSITRNDWEVS
jgi:hypothetical protein